VRLTESALTTKNYCTVDQLLIAPHHQSLIRYPDIRRESRFLPTPSGFDAPVRGGGHRWNIAITFGKKKTRTMWLPDGEKSWRYVYWFSTDTQDGHCTGCAYTYHRAAKMNRIIDIAVRTSATKLRCKKVLYCGLFYCSSSQSALEELFNQRGREWWLRQVFKSKFSLVWH